MKSISVILKEGYAVLNIMGAYWAMVQKEMSDHIRSWRFIILVMLIMLTTLGSLYTALSTIREAASNIKSNDLFLFLKLFTISDGTLPPFITFVGFLGPLLGIGLGFDAVNAERNKGTLSRILAQPIPRDYVINAKFTAALIIITFLLYSLGFLVMGLGMISIGIPPTPEEFLRIFFFLLLSVVYVSFWLNLAILFSVRFRQATTSALSSLAIWLFFSLFYSMLVNIFTNGIEADYTRQQVYLLLSRFSPSYLFSELTTTLLTPSIRSLGPLTMEQIYGAIPSPLPLGQSLLLIWPQLTGLLAATVIGFGISYLLFVRQEIRA